MSHHATINWTLDGGDFLAGRYSREHTWTFDGGVVVPASSSPSVVPVPFSNASCVDPEEALVAAISSCHMLSFLWVAEQAGLHVTAYSDAAEGRMGKHGNGAAWVSHVTLRPTIVFGEGEPPAPALLADLHERAHQVCFIANSVKTEITVAAPGDPA